MFARRLFLIVINFSPSFAGIRSLQNFLQLLLHISMYQLFSILFIDLCFCFRFHYNRNPFALFAIETSFILKEDSTAVLTIELFHAISESFASTQTSRFHRDHCVDMFARRLFLIVINFSPSFAGIRSLQNFLQLLLHISMYPLFSILFIDLCFCFRFHYNRNPFALFAVETSFILEEDSTAVLTIELFHSISESFVSTQTSRFQRDRCVDMFARRLFLIVINFSPSFAGIRSLQNFLQLLLHILMYQLFSILFIDLCFCFRLHYNRNPFALFAVETSFILEEDSTAVLTIELFHFIPLRW